MPFYTFTLGILFPGGGGEARSPGRSVPMKCFLACLLLVIALPLRADSECALLLASSSQSRELSATDKFRAYMVDLLEGGELGFDVFADFSRNLNEGVLANPVTEDVALRNYELEVHRSLLQEYVDSGGLDVGQLRVWALERLAKMKGNRARREVVHEETRDLTIEDAFPKVKMIQLPGGTFTMGSPKTEVGRYKDEGQVKVELSPFEIMDALVTQEMWMALMGNNPSHFEGLERPVESVSRSEAQEFLKRLNVQLGLKGKNRYRLPTEAEWEYAARAGTGTAYFFGDEPKYLKDYAVFDTNRTAPVRSKKPNPWGLYDMYGNVWEWMMDEELPGGKNPLQTNGRRPVVRGGGWGNDAQGMRSANRGSPWDDRHYNVGFRAVRTL